MAGARGIASPGQGSSCEATVNRAVAHSTSALKAAAMVRRSTDTNGAVYWISALLRTCAANHPLSGSLQSKARFAWLKSSLHAVRRSSRCLLP